MEGGDDPFGPISPGDPLPEEVCDTEPVVTCDQIIAALDEVFIQLKEDWCSTLLMPICVVSNEDIPTSLPHCIYDNEDICQYFKNHPGSNVFKMTSANLLSAAPARKAAQHRLEVQELQQYLEKCISNVQQSCASKSKTNENSEWVNGNLGKENSRLRTMVALNGISTYGETHSIVSVEYFIQLFFKYGLM